MIQIMQQSPAIHNYVHKESEVEISTRNSQFSTTDNKYECKKETMHVYALKTTCTKRIISPMQFVNASLLIIYGTYQLQLFPRKLHMHVFVI